jgi:hypothetical protein
MYQFSYLCVLTGRHRVGKSLCAVSFAHVLDKTFMQDFEKRIVYTPDQFLDAVEDIKRKKIIGASIVWDEANLGIPSREWYNISNRAINYSIQAFGYLRPIVFFVTQDMTFIDSQPRKLFHAFYEIKRGSNDYSLIYPFEISYNKRTGKMYYVYPRFSGSQGGSRGYKILMKPIRLMKPPKWLIKKYKAHSEIIKDELIDQMKDMAKSFKMRHVQEGDKGKLTEVEMLEVLKQEKDNKLFVNSRGRYRADIIKNEFGIPMSWAKTIKIKADIAKLENEAEEHDKKMEEEAEKEKTMF